MKTEHKNSPNTSKSTYNSDIVVKRRYATVEKDGISYKVCDTVIHTGDILLDDTQEDCIVAVSKSLSHYAKIDGMRGPVLVVGIGNEDIRSDALGHDVVSLLGDINMQGMCSEIMCLHIPIYPKSGIMSYEVLKSLLKSKKVGCIIVVDCLVTVRENKLCNNIQLSNRGLTPGAGVGNARTKIAMSTLSIPVISIGVPTILRGRTYLTSKDIDLYIDGYAHIISEGISRFCQLL